jgi:hypothetical protein
MSGAIIHSFKSRYGDERLLIAVNATTLLIEGPSHYTRGSSDDDGQVMADFEGGPFLMRGMTVEQCTDFPMQALIESVRFLPHETPGHARCEIKIKPDQQR